MTFAASEKQRAKVRDHACLVCWKTPVDPAHLIDRSLAPDFNGEPLRVVPLCRKHHDEYDRHDLDLLPHLEPRHRRELGVAVEIFGLVRTLERVTGMKWAPAVFKTLEDSEPIPYEKGLT